MIIITKSHFVLYKYVALITKDTAFGNTEQPETKVMTFGKCS